MKLVLLVAAIAALGAILATVWVGARVREDTVVARPYEEGLEYDAEHHRHAMLGWTVRLLEAPRAAGDADVVVEVRDRAGAPVAGAEVSLRIDRPETSRDEQTVAAHALGEGRYAARVRFEAEGPWELRFEVARGRECVREVRRVVVEGRTTSTTPTAAHPSDPCRLTHHPCTAPLPGGGDVTVALGPRPLRTMSELSVTADVRDAGTPVDGARVRVAFSMKGMFMGENRRELLATAPGRYQGTAVLVRCPSGRRDWTADVTVERPGRPPATVRFELAVAE